MQSNKDYQQGSGEHGMTLRKRRAQPELFPAKRTKLATKSSKQAKPVKPLTKKHISDPKMIKKLIEKAKKVLTSKNIRSQKRKSVIPKKDVKILPTNLPDVKILPMPEPEEATKEWYSKTTNE